MGSVTITVDAGVAGTTTKAFTVTNANLGRLADYGKTLAPGGPAPQPVLTNAQGLELWMRWVMDASKSNVLSSERAKATISDFEAT